MIKARTPRCQLSAPRRQASFALVVFVLLFVAMAPSARATVLPGTIKTNVVLTASGGPYTGTWVTVQKGASLTAEPGTVVKISGTLSIEGALNVNGTPAQPVVFTSIKDDSFGGDTNGDGSSSVPAPGDWGAVELRASSSGSLQHFKALYGGLSKQNAAVAYACPCSSPPAIGESVISHSYTSGIRVVKGAPAILASTISENKEAGIEVDSGSPEIQGNVISGNRTGVIFRVAESMHSTVSIEENWVKDNTEFGIKVYAHARGYIDGAQIGDNEVTGNGNKAIVYETFPNQTENPAFASNPIPSDITTNALSGNEKNGVWVSGNVRESQAWEDSGYALVVFEGLVVNKEGTLTLEPGLVIKGEEGSSITVRGAIASNGGVEEPVTFTSSKDDSAAGDTNGDGSATSAKPGDWKGLVYPSAEGVELDSLGLRYAQAALDIGHLTGVVIADSDFVHNTAAVKVSTTAELYPGLGALPCVFPYQAFVIAYRSWFSPLGLPAPSIDIAEVVGNVVPSEYASLLEMATAFGPGSSPNYGGENSIPFALYSCPPIGIPAIPVTPVVPVELAEVRHFPGP